MPNDGAIEDEPNVSNILPPVFDGVELFPKAGVAFAALGARAPEVGLEANEVNPFGLLKVGAPPKVG